MKQGDEISKASERRGALTDEQIEDMRARLKDPGPIASDDEVEAFFARFHATVPRRVSFTTKPRSTPSSTKK